MIGFHASADQLAVKGFSIKHYSLIINNNHNTHNNKRLYMSSLVKETYVTLYGVIIERVGMS